MLFDCENRTTKIECMPYNLYLINNSSRRFSNDSDSSDFNGSFVFLRVVVREIFFSEDSGVSLLNFRGKCKLWNHTRFQVFLHIHVARFERVFVHMFII